MNDTRPNRPRPARSADNISAVAVSFHDDPEESIRHSSQQLGLSYETTWPILRRDLGLKVYKIELMQELKPADLPQRHNFSIWALDKIAEDPLFQPKFFFVFFVQLCFHPKFCSGSFLAEWLRQ